MKSARALIFAALVVTLLFAPLGASAGETRYNAVIPGVLSYPTTTLSFSFRSLLGHTFPVLPAGVSATFDNPNWAATVSAIHWKTTSSGTYVKFTCRPDSSACMQATGGTGSYTYSLLPSTDLAPAKAGQYTLTWYVNPPGGYHDDDQLNVTTPETGTLLLVGVGLLSLLLLARARPLKSLL